MVAQIGCNALGTRHHVAVRQHHPLGHAGAAAGVKNGRHVGVDDAMPWPGWPRQQGLPSEGRHLRHRAGQGCTGGAVGQHHTAQRPTLTQYVSQLRQPIRGGDQDPHIAVAHHVTHLLGLEQRIDRHKHAPGGRRPEAGHHGLDPLVQVDGHPATALETQTHQPGRKGLDLQMQRLVT